MSTKPCHAEDCDEPRLPGRALCRVHRAQDEAKKRLDRKETTRHRPCSEPDCQNPRFETPSQVLPYCVEHRRARARTSDNARRRAAGIPQRTPVAQPDGLPADEKWCPGGEAGGHIKKRWEFHLNKGHSDGLQTKCKACQALDQRRVLSTPEGKKRIADYRRPRNRSWLYNLPPHVEKLLLEEQDHRCAVCRQPFEVNAKTGQLIYVVDHVRHTKDDVRGLLHNNCNTGLGLLGDHDPLVLLAAAIYLAHGSGFVPDDLEKLRPMLVLATSAPNR